MEAPRVTEEPFIIRSLEASDAVALAALLQSQSPEYARFFRPFDFDETTLRRLLCNLKQDVMSGLYWQGKLVGFYMLRGWDEGYEVPSYGVLIDEHYHGYGLTSLTIRMAKIVCKMRGAKRLMLKVHPDNLPAKTLYEKARFVLAGTEASSNNLIYYFDVDNWAAKF